jgi:hypothetical protein
MSEPVPGGPIPGGPIPGGPVPVGRRRLNILLGIARLARGRADGLAQFGDTRQAFLASLLPLLAFPLLGELLVALRGGMPSLSDLLATVCALLAPPVLSFSLARRWGREAQWPRFATAFNWCQWAIPAIAFLLLLAMSLLIALGVPNEAAGHLWILSLAAYGVWLHWFLARRALELTAVRAVVLVVLVNAATVAMVIGPLLIANLAEPSERLGG